jgi:hypothetical protein
MTETSGLLHGRLELARELTTRLGIQVAGGISPPR